MNKGFFGNLQGPFTAGENLMNLIKTKHETTETEVDYLSKLGIHFINNFRLEVNSENEPYPATKYLKILINDETSESAAKVFQIGATGILEFQDVKIISLSFPQGAQDIAYIDYQYQNKNK